MFQDLLDADCKKMNMADFVVEQALAQFLRLADRNLSQAHFILRNCLGTPKAQLARRYLETQPHHPSDDFFPYLRPFHEPPKNPYGYVKRPPWPTQIPHTRDRRDIYTPRVETTRRGEKVEGWDVEYPSNTRENIIAELDRYFTDTQKDHTEIVLEQLQRFEEYVAKGWDLENG